MNWISKLLLISLFASCSLHKKIRITSIPVSKMPLGTPIDTFLRTVDSAIIINSENLGLFSAPPGVSWKKHVEYNKDLVIELSERNQIRNKYADSIHYIFSKGYLRSIILFSSEAGMTSYLKDELKLNPDQFERLNDSDKYYVSEDIVVIVTQIEGRFLIDIRDKNNEKYLYWRI